jgi:circadian clock protein KaiC
VHGAPGTGKTTVGLHFLSNSGRSLLITFIEPEERIRDDARTLGFELNNVSFLDLTPYPETFSECKTYDIFSPYEVERDRVAQQMAAGIAKVNPDRVFVDGFETFRNLTGDPFHYHRFAQAFFRFATRRDCTVLGASDQSDAASIVDGVIELHFAGERRSLRVTKFRGSDFQPGSHSMRLTGSGIQVLPNAA